MTGTGPVDDRGGAIAGALAAKADQLVVGEPRCCPFDDDGPPAPIFHLTPPRPSLRRLVAAAAAAPVAAGRAAARRFGARARRTAEPTDAGRRRRTRQHGRS